MKPNRCSLCLLVLAAALTLVPAQLTAQRRWVLGVGIGRQLPQRPILNAEGAEPDYKLDEAGSSVVSVDYWFNRFLGTRVAYQWVRTDIGEPDIPSFARVYSLYGGLVLSPGTIARRATPFLAAGAGARRYDVNATLTGGPADDYDIAPTQHRLTSYGGVGVGVRVGRVELVPEVGAFMNDFKPARGTAPTQLDVLVSLKVQFR